MLEYNTACSKHVLSVIHVMTRIAFPSNEPAFESQLKLKNQ